MTCPTCARAMTPTTAGPLTVDACVGGCGGLWFNQFELAKVDSASEADGAALSQLPRDPAWVAPKDAPPRSCPTCPDVVMVQRFASVQRGVEVDECGLCGGVFVDGGELSTIRAEYTDDAARDAAAKAFLASIDEQLLAMRAQRIQGQSDGQRAASALRLLTPGGRRPGRGA